MNHTSFLFHRWRWLAWPAAAAALLAALYAARYDSLLWYLWWSGFGEAKPQALGLAGYRAEIQARPLGMLDDVSGLTYNAETGTLFTVLNQAPYIVELGLQGQVLRKIQVGGARDMEGITHIAGRRYVIAEEGSNRLIEIELADGQQQVDTRHARQLQLALEAPGNKNFEGVSWDGRQQRLLVVKEKHPLRLLEIRGFVNAGREPLRVTELSGTRLSLGPLRDLSSVTYDDASGQLLLLSDESRLVRGYDSHGRAIDAMALWRGFHGLQQHVPQAEGIALGPDRRLYLISEPNLLYVFRPAPARAPTTVVTAAR